jgi:putative salt-induced outer membrane protein YdiY
MPDPARRFLQQLAPSLFLTLATLIGLPAAYGDEVVLRDGSRLVGTVVSRDDGTLGFKTAFADTIKIKWSEIATISTEKPMEFLLADDRTLMVTQVTNNSDDMTVTGEDGATTLAQADVSIINPEPWRKGEGMKFSGHANAGLSRQRGNTDKDELDLDADLTLRRKNDRFKSFAELEKDRAENEKIKDAWKFDGNYDYFVTEKWYWGGFIRFEHDQFADLNLRTSVGPLIGYQWIESKQMNLSTSTGISYVSEDFDTQPDDEYAAIPWNINFDMYLFDEFAQFYHRQNGFWSLEDYGDLVADTWTGLRFPLVLGLVATTELKLSYDGSVPSSASKTDTTYSLKLGYSW